MTSITLSQAGHARSGGASRLRLAGRRRRPEPSRDSDVAAGDNRCLRRDQPRRGVRDLVGPALPAQRAVRGHLLRHLGHLPRRRLCRLRVDDAG